MALGAARESKCLHAPFFGKKTLKFVSSALETPADVFKNLVYFFFTAKFGFPNDPNIEEKYKINEDCRENMVFLTGSTSIAKVDGLVLLVVMVFIIRLVPNLTCLHATCPSCFARVVDRCVSSLSLIRSGCGG